MAEITNAVQYDVLNDGSVVKIATADFKGETIPVGTCIWDFTGLDRPGYLNLAIDHGLLQRSEYPQLWATIEAMIENLGSNSASVVLTDAAWLATVATSGGVGVGFETCGRFSRGDGSTTFRLPLIRQAFLRVFANGDPANLGVYQPDQMRPITGAMASFAFAARPSGSQSSGAFTAVSTGTQSNLGAGTSGYYFQNVNFNSGLLGTNFSDTTTHPRNVAANLLMKVVDTSTATFQQGTYSLAPSTIPLRGQNGYSQDWQGAFTGDGKILLTVPTAWTNIIMPATGWLCAKGVTTAPTGGFIMLQGRVFNDTFRNWANADLAVSIPVTQGELVNIAYSTANFTIFELKLPWGAEV